MKTNKTFTTIISRTAMTLLLAVLTTATAWAQTVQFPIYEGDEGTEAKPYQIKTAADLNKLSEDVNSGTVYKDKYFKLMDNIYFSHSSTWNDITSEENNFDPIGREVNLSHYYFRGIFDGNDKTISGIRIYKDTKDYTSSFNGLFGLLKGTVKKLTLTDTRIVGFSFTGGIAGSCSTNSLIDHCTVTSTVAIYANQHGALRYGGIVGDAGGDNTKITNNTCSATVVVKDGFTGCAGFGGILGSIDSKATVSNNLAIGATVKDSSGRAGAIMGYSNPDANLTNNYYINCTVNGTANALNVGCHAEDVTENCAAVSLHRLTLTDGVTTTTPPSVNIGGTDYYGHGTTINLSTTPPATYMGYIYGDSYIVNGEAISGSTFTMPAQDTEVTSSFTTVPIYKLTQADGITATGTIAATYGDDNYYLAGTTITLSGTQTSTPPVGTIYDGYAVNGTAISGNTFTMPAQDTEVTSATMYVYSLTLAAGITTSTTPTITFGDTPYYLAGTTIYLEVAPPATYQGYIYDGYAVNGEAISGSTFTMPAQATTVTLTNATKPIYKLTLADGITAAGTIAATYDDDNYYLEGTTITLSGGLAEVSAENEYAAYIVNGEEINGHGFIMPATAVTVSADIFSAEWAGEGTESSPYLIQNCHQLKLLARRVNTGAVDTDDKPYSDKSKWYKLVADLQFDYTGLGETESNFEAIGIDLCRFIGHFLGSGHTISGIRIRKGSETCQGLFGSVWSSEISGVILTDADITGEYGTGGIVGINYHGTVTDCHVTSTVTIRATENETSCHGGIAGVNFEGIVSSCTSAATLTIENGATRCDDYGGIVGHNVNDTLNDNLALGVHLPDISDSFAIIGDDYSDSRVTLLRNYYSNCTKEGADEVFGCEEGDISDNDGSVPGIALYDHSDFSGLNSQILQTAGINHPRVDLAGRTLYRDGDWNTLCLPFAIAGFASTPLADATVMELDVEDTYDGHKTGVEDNTLYLYFKQVNSIEAGKPYIVKWTTTAEDITNPVFSNVVISSTTPTDITFTGGAFKGTYEKISYTQENKSILFLGTNNQLFWPQPNGDNNPSIGAFRAYFELTDGQQARDIATTRLFFGDGETNGITTTNLTNYTNLAGAWYTIDGRKLSGKPTQKGLYILGNKKVIIK